jgi:two-component system phosphate regulon sensor histidine kinase PhoR
VLCVALFFGVIFGHNGTFLFLGLLAYFAWHAWRLRRLARWLIYRNEAEPHFGDDIWGEVFYQIQRRKTRARKRERRLKAMIRLYRESSAALPDGAVILRADNSIEWMNEAAADMLGLRHNDAGRRIDNLVRHPEFVRFLHAGDYEDALEFASPVVEDRTMEIHIVPYGNEQRLLVTRDITRLHRLEVMRRDFIANVSHELSTPLTVISGYLESLIGRSGQSERVEAAFEQMRQQAERMTHLVNDLLQLSRLEIDDAHETETEVDVAAMLRGLVTDASMMGRQRPHEIVLEADESVVLRGVSKHLYSAFANLIRNAAQYTPVGGRIEIRWYGDRGGACFEVKDTGLGIPASAIPRLTERFYRVDTGRSRAVGGTGLGLSIVKHVLRNHQGNLQIESAPGKGSTFSCVFPGERVMLRDGRQCALL